jgi:hypothetical protein
MQHALVLVLGLALVAPVLAQNGGIQASPDTFANARWQARLERDQAPLASRAGTPLWLLDNSASGLRLLGDYQFNSLRLGATGGLRLTGGLLLSLRQSHGATHLAADAGQSPVSGRGYAGVGYASGSASGDFGFSADLGLTGMRFGQASGGVGPGLRDGRLQPMLRLGMNLAF